ncbi:MAG: hypothetical protein GWO02_13040 [Gammaproteobacteria bacterium]|nr:hypothetical protein [Gammaproteobacteria bacterium]
MPELPAELPETPGVYAADPRGEPQLVHAFLPADYGLTDIAEHFRLGRVERGARPGHRVLALSPRELRELKVAADAYSFDYEEGFIEMCHDIMRFAAERPGETLRFVAND